MHHEACALATHRLRLIEAVANIGAVRDNNTSHVADEDGSNGRWDAISNIDAGDVGVDVEVSVGCGSGQARGEEEEEVSHGLN